MKYRNNDERYGDAGPFEAESVAEIVRDMQPNFEIWANEAWAKLTDSSEHGEYHGPLPDRDEFIAAQIETMREECAAALEPAAQQTIDVGGRMVNLSVYSDLPAGLAMPDLSGDSWRYRCTDTHDNDVEAVYSWKIGEMWLHIFTDQGYPESAEFSDQDHMAYLAEICDNMAQWVDQDRSEIMAGFDIDFPTFLTEAAADFEGECRVWHMPNYYTGHYNRPMAAFARDDNDQIITFENLAAAQKYCRDYYSEPSCYDGIPQCNVLSHGQAASDDLRIVEAE